MKSKEYGLIQLMQNQKDDYRNKNKELSKLKLKLAFDFPVGMEEQLGGHTKTMLNKQLRFLDGLDCLRREIFASERLHGRSGRRQKLHFTLLAIFDA